MYWIIWRISKILRNFLNFFHNFLEYWRLLIFLDLFVKFRKNSSKSGWKIAFSNKILWNFEWTIIQNYPNWDAFFAEILKSERAKECKSCRSRKMVKNATTLAIVAVHTAENEPLKIWGDLFSLFSSLLNHQGCGRDMQERLVQLAAQPV